MIVQARPMNPRPSLSRKLIFLVAAAVGTGMCVSTGVAFWQETVHYTATRREALLATAEVFSAAVAPAAAAGRGAEAMMALRGIGRLPDIEHVELRGSDGRILATLGAAVRLAGDAALGPHEQPSLVNLLASRTVQVTVPIVH